MHTDIPLRHDFTTPDWAKRAVWYQILPERFRNGDPSNDPQLDDLRGAYPHDLSTPWHIHPWGADWYTLQPYEQANGRSLWHNLQRRRYGGDLQGIIDKLDYLHDLGITAIYLNPVFAAPSHHKYDAATYHHIDPNFGPDPTGDRRLVAQEIPHDPATWVWTAADKLALRLIDAVHRRGMRIIFDGVFNHMGINSWIFRDVAAKQQESLYKDWLEVLSWNDPVRGTKFNYSGWWAVKELPELRQDENGTVEGPKKYIFAATRRWLAPLGEAAAGIDGWRLDVAYEIRHNFWKEWRALVKSINPDAYLSAEIVSSIAYLQPFLGGDEFDAIMHYNFAFACLDFFVEPKQCISALAFDRRLLELREAFGREVAYAQQNLLDSHDCNRITSHIVNAGLGSIGNWKQYHEMSKATNPRYQTRKPTTDEYRVQKLLAIFQMTYVGAPMIYYGDEAGIWGANDPCCRKPMLWDDVEYADATMGPDGKPYDTPQPVAFDRDMFAHYRKIIHLRNSHPALQIGDYRTLLADDDRDIFVFLRTLDTEQIIVALNRGRSPETAVIEENHATRFYDHLNDETVLAQEDGRLVVQIPPSWGRILRAENRPTR